jgi:mannobiose 2-epimerase
MPDEEKGGFLAGILTSGEVVRSGPKGAVLNARILWSFSALAIHFRDSGSGNDPDDRFETCSKMATRAFGYLIRFFRDPEYAGYFWSVDQDGLPFQDRKQTYAQAFVLYGFTEYCRLTGDKLVLELANELFTTIESFGYNQETGGYTEAFNRDWSPVTDLKLSPKDLNEPFSLNTHLHVLEAYSSFWKVAPAPEVRNSLIRLYGLFSRSFLNRPGHLNMFFDQNWNPSGRLVSYGHDIETSWLLEESLAGITDNPWRISIMAKTRELVDAFYKEAILEDGSVRYEYDPFSGHDDRDRHWWVQAEGMTGLLRAWKHSGNEDHLLAAHRIWRYIRDRMKDPRNGEWYWRLDPRGKWFAGDTIAGFWKCPYHNSRACLEAIRILKSSE